jgi:hypothetical protein
VFHQISPTYFEIISKHILEFFPDYPTLMPMVKAAATQGFVFLAITQVYGNEQ